MTDMSEQMKASLITWMAAGVPWLRERQDAESGRFLAENGGWAITMQDPILNLAVLFTTEHRDNPYYHDGEVLSICVRGGNALVDAQYDDGTFEFIKPDGSRWGRIYMPWTFYHWVEAFATLGDLLPPEPRARWSEALELGFNGICRETAENQHVHNIPTWRAMSLVRAGQILGKDNWVEVGRQGIYRATEAQAPDGYWPEGGGPTTSYNFVYVHALGLYYHFTGDERVLEPLRRATEFHVAFTYPDGSPVETVDGRVPYCDHARIVGLPGFLQFPEGRALSHLILDALWDQFQAARRKAEATGGTVSSAPPHAATAFQLIDQLADATEAQIPQRMERYESVFRGRAAVLKRGPFYACLSGYLTPTEDLWWTLEERWIKSRQNYISLWHERLGLLLGGGNSKYSPKYSTFNVLRGRRHTPVADRAEIEIVQGGAGLELLYDGVRCEAVVQVLDEMTVRVKFRAQIEEERQDQETRCAARLTVRLVAGEKLTYHGQQQEVDPLSTMGLTLEPDASLTSERGWSISCSQEARLHWPEYPFNPYAIDNAAPAGSAHGVLAVQLLPERDTAEVIVKIEA